MAFLKFGNEIACGSSDADRGFFDRICRGRRKYLGDRRRRVPSGCDLPLLYTCRPTCKRGHNRVVRINALSSCVPSNLLIVFKHLEEGLVGGGEAKTVLVQEPSWVASPNEHSWVAKIWVSGSRWAQEPSSRPQAQLRRLLQPPNSPWEWKRAKFGLSSACRRQQRRATRAVGDGRIAAIGNTGPPVEQFQVAVIAALDVDAATAHTSPQSTSFTLLMNYLSEPCGTPMPGATTPRAGDRARGALREAGAPKGAMTRHGKASNWG
jgi:hypothetical protein